MASMNIKNTANYWSSSVFPFNTKGHSSCV